MVIELSKLKTRQSNLRAEHQINKMAKDSEKIEEKVIENETEIEELSSSISESQRRNGGPTSDRPDIPKDYEFYFDTDLGQPIWYNGTEWVDYEGNTL